MQKAWELIAVLAISTLLLLSPVALASPGTIQLIGKEWSHDPLKVYIKAPSDLVPEILTTLNDWSRALEAASGSAVDDSELRSGPSDGIFDFVVVSSSKEADIEISVQNGAAAGVLGMALTLDRDGDGVFDKVKITVKAGRGFDRADFRNVLRHEIGHALGLGHETTDEPDLMDPTYDSSGIGYDIFPSDLDIRALLHIYGVDGFGLPNLLPSEIPTTYQ